MVLWDVMMLFFYFFWWVLVFYNVVSFFCEVNVVLVFFFVVLYVFMFELYLFVFFWYWDVIFFVFSSDMSVRRWFFKVLVFFSFSFLDNNFVKFFFVFLFMLELCFM